METNQIMEEYFTIHSPEDPIDLPFQYFLVLSQEKLRVEDNECSIFKEDI